MMAREISFTVSVFSPRWGHDDIYTIRLSEEKMEIASVPKSAICSKKENGDCIWSGYNERTGNPLVRIFQNDSVYPPSVFISAMESAWAAWLNNRLDDIQAEEELKELFEWLNVVSKSKPRSDFWTGIF
jgi:hypothetical protein